MENENYLHNFVQSIFDSHEKSEFVGKGVLVGGDGRYWNDEAINVTLKFNLDYHKSLCW